MATHVINVGQFDTSTLVDNPGHAVDSTLFGAVTLGNGLAMNLGGGDNTVLLNQVTLHGAAGNNLNIKSGDGTSTFTINNTDRFPCRQLRRQRHAHALVQ